MKITILLFAFIALLQMVMGRKKFFEGVKALFGKKERLSCGQQWDGKSCRAVSHCFWNNNVGRCFGKDRKL